MSKDWNPDEACNEMADLFRQADEILDRPHYEDASADSFTRSSTGTSQRPTQTNRKDN